MSNLKAAFNAGFLKRAEARGFREDQAAMLLGKTAGNGALIGRLMSTAKNLHNVWPAMSKTSPAAYDKMYNTYNTLKGLMSQGIAPKTNPSRRTIQADYTRLLKHRVNNLNPQASKLQSK
jgi:hypothetical protein